MSITILIDSGDEVVLFQKEKKFKSIKETLMEWYKQNNTVPLEY